MKTILPLAILAAVLTGCQSPGQVERSWYKPWTWRADKTADERKTSDAKAKAERAVDANSEALIHAAAAKVAATGAALDARKAREPATDLAATFNGQAAALLPQPTVAELTELRAIVGGLLSTNAAERAAAADRLAVKDKELAELQRLTGELKARLETAEQSHSAAVAKLTTAYAQERGVADQWRAEQAKTWGKRLLDLLGTGGLIALASTGVLSIPLAGRAFGFFARVMPSSSAVTGVVSRMDFTNAVGAVDNFKNAVKAGSVDGSVETVMDALKTALAGAQNPASEPLVDAARLAYKAAEEKKLRRKKTLGL